MGQNVSFIVLRPTRFTKALVDASGGYSLSFFGEDYRQQLGYFGKVSGRDEDKIKKSGLAVDKSASVPYFSAADTVMLCRKLYAQPMAESCFTDKAPFDKWYDSADDLHTLYVGEITDLFRRVKA